MVSLRAGGEAVKGTEDMTEVFEEFADMFLYLCTF